jgi:hypothetical protein
LFFVFGICFEKNMKSKMIENAMEKSFCEGRKRKTGAI